MIFSFFLEPGDFKKVAIVEWILVFLGEFSFPSLMERSRARNIWLLAHSHCKVPSGLPITYHFANNL